MTDRYHSLVVVLEKDKRDDDCQCIIDAIKMIKGVLNVSGNISNPESWMAEERARNELGRKIMDVVINKRIPHERLD